MSVIHKTSNEHGISTQNTYNSYFRDHHKKMNSGDTSAMVLKNSQLKGLYIFITIIAIPRSVICKTSSEHGISTQKIAILILEMLTRK